MERTEKFKKEYKKLCMEDRTAIDKALIKFFNEPKPASLRIKKIQGKNGVYEMSANMDIRITFNYEKEPAKIILRNCGHHDQTLKNP
jgi:mRNA-degrading endonuclease RelE of RelBE toxin-antitoxin system